MNFKFRFADQIVGLFVLTSVVLICVALILIGINKRWLRDDLIYSSRFISAKGMRVGMSVTLKGFKIGELKTFNLNDENLVDVTFVIYEEYLNKIVQDSVIEVQVSPIGLGSSMLFFPGIEEGKPLPEGSMIFSTHFVEGRKLVKEGKVDKGNSGDPIDTVLKDADEMILSLNSVLIDIDEILLGYNPGPIGEILIGIETMMPEINGIIGNVNSSTLPKIDRSLSDINKVTRSIAILSRELESIEGIISQVLDPESSIATFLNDDKVLFAEVFGILDEIHKSMIQVRELTEYFNGLSPEITALVEGTGSAIEEVEKVLQGIKNNPLLRGGIEEEKQQDTVSSSMRDGEF
ncbi:MAG: MCE family protein [Spirochaetaceae bacterium]|nr:MCE family protein [Spirochaetaceae bacterium]